MLPVLPGSGSVHRTKRQFSAVSGRSAPLLTKLGHSISDACRSGRAPLRDSMPLHGPENPSLSLIGRNLPATLVVDPAAFAAAALVPCCSQSGRHRLLQHLHLWGRDRPRHRPGCSRREDQRSAHIVTCRRRQQHNQHPPRPVLHHPGSPTPAERCPQCCCCGPAVKV